MINHQLFPRTHEEAKAVIPLLERLTKENFRKLKIIREDSGEGLEVKINRKTVARSCARENIVYYMAKADKDRRGFEIAVEIKNMYETYFPESGGWIVRYVPNENDKRK